MSFAYNPQAELYFFCGRKLRYRYGKNGKKFSVRYEPGKTGYL